jgi:hypothetical protein
VSDAGVLLGVSGSTGGGTSTPLKLLELRAILCYHAVCDADASVSRLPCGAHGLLFAFVSLPMACP